jgi:hypothetical protein
MHRFVRIIPFCVTSVCLAAQWTPPVRFEPANAAATRFIGRGLGYGFQIAPREATVSAKGSTVRLRFEGATAARLEGTGRMRSTTNILGGNDPSRWRHGIPHFGRVIAHEVYPGIDVVYYTTAGQLEYDLVLRPGADPRSVRLRISGANATIDDSGNLVAGIVHKRPVTYVLTAAGKKQAMESRFRRNADGTFGFDVAAYDRRNELVIDPQLTLSSYLAGTQQDIAVSVGHDSQGLLYVAGTTYSTDLEASDSAFQTANTGGSDLFVAKLDPTQPVGAQLIYITYVGGSSDDTLHAMAVAGDGTVYLTGVTKSIDFPLGNAAQSTLDGASDAFVLWLDLAQTGASAMYYGTYLGGANDDAGNGIAVDRQGRIVVVGTTNSTDLPASNGWNSSLLGGSDAFVAVFDTSQSAAGTLYYSTYLGGTNWDEGRGIAAASDGTIWVTGASISGDFPLTGLSYQPYYQGGGDVFVSQINPDVAGSSSLIYSTYLGGSNTDEGNAIYLDAAGRVIVTGFTLSPDLPVTAGAAQKQLGSGASSAGAANAFVAVLVPSTTGNPTSQLTYLTYLGGTGGDEAYSVTADPAGNIYVAGLTKSKDFPVTDGAMQTALLGGPAGFMTRLNPAKATLDYSTYVTSIGNQTVYGVDLGADGTVYLCGFTTSTLLDSLGGMPKFTDAGNADGFVFGFELPPSVQPKKVGAARRHR